MSWQRCDSDTRVPVPGPTRSSTGSWGVPPSVRTASLSKNGTTSLPKQGLSGHPGTTGSHRTRWSATSSPVSTRSTDAGTSLQRHGRPVRRSLTEWPKARQSIKSCEVTASSGSSPSSTTWLLRQTHRRPRPTYRSRRSRAHRWPQQHAKTNPLLAQCETDHRHPMSSPTS